MSVPHSFIVLMVLQSKLCLKIESSWRLQESVCSLYFTASRILWQLQCPLPQISSIRWHYYCSFFSYMLQYTSWLCVHSLNIQSKLPTSRTFLKLCLQYSFHYVKWWVCRAYALRCEFLWSAISNQSTMGGHIEFHFLNDLSLFLLASRMTQLQA